MAISGSGTEQDPYIVDTWSDFQQVNTLAYTDSYVKFSGQGFVSLVLQNRSGYDGLEIFPHLDGNGFTFRDFYSSGSNPMVFYQEVKNLNILNFCYIGDSNSVFYFKGNADNLRINGIAIGNTSTTVFAFDEDCLMWNSSLNILSTSSNFALIKDSNGGIAYSHIDLSVSATSSACIAESSSTPTISNCLFTGSINSPTITNVLMNSNTFEYNVYDLTLSSAISVIGDGSNLISASAYNNEKMTVTTASNSIISCSSEQMIDSAYLRSHGFAMAY